MDFICTVEMFSYIRAILKPTNIHKQASVKHMYMCIKIKIKSVSFPSCGEKINCVQ